MPDSESIVCKPTNWVKIRGVLILAMLGVFAVLFYIDGKSGYREKNLRYFVHRLMTKQAPNIASDKERGFDEASWRDFASKQTVPFPDESEGPLPEGSRGMEWPQELVDNFEALKGGDDGAVKLWKAYSGERKWDEVVSEKPYDQGKINEQFYFAYGAAGLFLVVLFFFLRILSRKMVATDEAYIAPGGRRIAYSQMKKIDKRKWDSKGIAEIYYDDGGQTKKAKVDGMIYGQFKKQDGEPAEKLFAKIMGRFKGEVVEYEEVENLEEEEREKAV